MVLHLETSYYHPYSAAIGVQVGVIPNRARVGNWWQERNRQSGQCIVLGMSGTGSVSQSSVVGPAV